MGKHEVSPVGGVQAFTMDVIEGIGTEIDLEQVINEGTRARAQVLTAPFPRRAAHGAVAAKCRDTLRCRCAQ
jgi:hypothetical protein